MANLNINGQLGFELLSSQAKQVLLDFVYPIDTYFITENTTLFPDEDSVKNHFGGTWKRLNSRFLYATSNPSTVAQEDGEASHVLTIDEIPSHTHTQDSHRHLISSKGAHGMSGNSSAAYYSDGNTTTNNSAMYTQYVQPTINATGGSQPHNNMPPYRKVLMYRRIR